MSETNRYVDVDPLEAATVTGSVAIVGASIQVSASKPGAKPFRFTNLKSDPFTGVTAGARTKSSSPNVFAVES